MKIGNKVNIKYYQGTALNIHKPGEEQPDLGATVTEEGSTAALGERPAAEAEQVVTTTVEIADVDLYKKTISFRSPDKGYRTV